MPKRTSQRKDTYFKHIYDYSKSYENIFLAIERKSSTPRENYWIVSQIHLRNNGHYSYAFCAENNVFNEYVFPV